MSQQSDIDPEAADAGVPVSEHAVPVKSTQERQQSTMGIAGIESVLEKAMIERDMDQETRDLVSRCVKSIDRDNNGRVDRHELVNFAINLTGQLQALQKKNQSWMKMIKSYRRGLVSAVGIIVLLCASIFGVSVAVAELTKDVAVSSKGVMTRAGTDDLVKTGVSGLELVALAPADESVNLGGGTKFLGCLFQDQVDLLGTESFFTGTVIDSPDGSKHVIQVHDYENTSDGGAKIVDTSGVEYHIKKAGKICETARTRDGRRLLGDVSNSYSLYQGQELRIAVFTSLPFDFGMGVNEPTVSSYGTYNEQMMACLLQGMRLCTLSEICNGRGGGDFNRAFDIPASVASSDSWVAYDTIASFNDGCGALTPGGYGDGYGCTGNGWVQIGTWGNGIGRTCKTHCEVTAEFYGGPQCPSWGTGDGDHGYTPNSYLCCNVS